MEQMLESHRGWRPPDHGKSAAVMRAGELLRYELAARRGLREIARIVGMHPVQLCRDFKKHFRCTMGEYLRRCRVEKARLLLTKFDIPLSEIGLQCGFYDQSHFIRTFRKLVGVNPLQYRKKQRE